MSRIRKTYEATIHGVTVRGAESVTMAKQEAVAAIEAHAKNPDPRVFRLASCTVVIAHVLQSGWQYFVAQDGEALKYDQSPHFAASKQDADRRARRMVADLLWTLDSGIEPPDFVTDEQDREEYRRSSQRHYEFYRIMAAGYSGNESHRMAGTGDPARRRLDTDPPAKLPFDPADMPIYRAGYERWNAERIAA